MEKYSQFRDKGSGIAPFFPVPSQPSGIYLPLHVFLFVSRLFLLIPFSLFYFLVLSWLPFGFIVKKAVLWLLIGIPGIWWIDLQIDGVKRGSLAKHNAHRLPGPKSIIVSSFTSPLDCLYLAAIFDPVFTASYPSTRKVERISLLSAMLRALQPPKRNPSPNAKLTDLPTLLEQHPDASILVLPECTTTNGRGILPFSPSLLTAPPTAKIFPLNLRYTPPDVTTPIPGRYATFLWNLLSKPTHCIRVRIAEAVRNDTRPSTLTTTTNSYDTNYFDQLDRAAKAADADDDDETALELGEEERKFLDRIGEDLARLGRVKRVALGVRDKEEFLKLWLRRH